MKAETRVSRNQIARGVVLLTVVAICWGGGCSTVKREGGKEEEQTVTWVIDNLKSIGGHEVEVVGDPKVVETDKGKAVAFDGKDDGIFLNVDPVEGRGRFTVEILFRPDADGPAEQRFFHIQEDGSPNRVLLETRVPGGGKWYADTYICSGKSQAALNDPKLTHAADRWHTLALVCTGEHMTQYVDGKKELESRIAFKPHKKGRTSIGVRINKVHWFKGAVRLVRISPKALKPEELL